ncbi:HNH endonuclease signature motif containing protein [Brachybacterium sp.]|uniref:HNH endonuclease signature motif containing protein n=1 Tax=Brachybacterium sp. TaxID=1891286 RepID=UPI002ED1B301
MQTTALNPKRGIAPALDAPSEVTDALLDVYASWPERFRSKVHMDAGCWEWLRSRQRNGYGRYGLGPRGAGWAVAHRVAYELTYGEIPEGLVLDHLCGNAGCVRPDHLEAVAQVENVNRGAASNASGVCRAGKHQWVPQNIIVETSGARRCRPCRDDREREYRPHYKAGKGARHGTAMLRNG